MFLVSIALVASISAQLVIYEEVSKKTANYHQVTVQIPNHEPRGFLTRRKEHHHSFETYEPKKGGGWGHPSQPVSFNCERDQGCKCQITLHSGEYSERRSSKPMTCRGYNDIIGHVSDDPREKVANMRTTADECLIKVNVRALIAVARAKSINEDNGYKICQTVPSKDREPLPMHGLTPVYPKATLIDQSNVGGLEVKRFRVPSSDGIKKIYQMDTGVTYPRAVGDESRDYPAQVYCFRDCRCTIVLPFSERPISPCQPGSPARDLPKRWYRDSTDSDYCKVSFEMRDLKWYDGWKFCHSLGPVDGPPLAFPTPIEYVAPPVVPLDEFEKALPLRRSPSKEDNLETPLLKKDHLV